MQRREEQPSEHDHQAAEPNDDAVDPPLGLLKPGLKPQLERAYVRSDELEVLLGGDVVVDRVENLGGDPFGLLAVDIGVRQGIDQGKPVGQWRLRSKRSAFGMRRKADAEPAVSGSTPYPSRRAF